ncbi:TetR/AcrR family transcriptional regulator [soil metagenome]
MSTPETIPEKLIRVSVELFAEKGYAYTSVQEIVEAAGVTKGALYHYFTAKDDLLFDIYDRILSLQRAHIDEIVARELPPLETLRLICEDVVITSIDQVKEGTVFFASQHMLEAERAGEVKGRRREYNDVFLGVLSAAQAVGDVRTDIPSTILIAHFFSDLHYLGQWYRPGGSQSKEQIGRELTDLYLAGLRPHDTK